MMKINLDGIHTNLRFSSAHMVIGHPSCGRIHGHSYIVDIEVGGEPAGEFGFVMDFKVLKDISRNVLKTLDHRLLIPYNSPDLDVTYEDESTIEFTLLNKSQYKIPKTDVVLLPTKSTTAESLSIYITEEILSQITQKDNLDYLEVQVNEGIGQGASYTYYFNE